MRIRKWLDYLFGLAMLLVTVALAAGIFPVNSDQSLAAGIDSQSNRYQVKSGDSLSTVARTYGTSAAALEQENKIQSEVSAIPTTDQERYYVQKGDTLFLIADKYGISVNSIKQANGLTTDMMIPGQILMIPVNSSNGGAVPVNTDRMFFSSSSVDSSWSNGGAVPGNTDRSLGEILRENSTGVSSLTILVDKSDHTLSILSGGVRLKSYHVEFGDNGQGDKEVAGDHKTPEGTFYICEKSILSPADQYLGSRWMRLSYPNIEDANRGLQQGLINQSTYEQIVSAVSGGKTPPQHTALGGGIGIHGGSTSVLGSDWTWGCVGLTNQDVEDFYDYVKVGTPVTIQK